MKPLAQELKQRGGAIRVECVDGAADAANLVKQWVMPGDAVLIKGSNASGMGRVGSQLREWSAAGMKPQKAGGA